MKYYININQYAFATEFPSLDIKDMAIFMYLSDFCSNGSARIKRKFMQDKDGMSQYTWINTNNLIKEMPSLAIKDKSTILDRMAKLEKEGLIHIKREEDRSNYVRILERALSVYTNTPADDLLVETNTPVGLNLQHKQYISKQSISSVSKDTPPKEKDTIHSDIGELFSYYKKQFLNKVSNTPPVFNWGACEKLAKPLMKDLGLEHMKHLIDVYMSTRDQFYVDNAYSLSCFLSTKIIHKLNQKK